MSDQNPFDDPNYGLAPGQKAPVNPFDDANYGKETDGPLARGWKKSKQNMAITSDLAMQDSAGAAQTVKEADDYARANPSRPEGAKLMDAWNRGDGVMGGVSEVAGQIKDNYDQADGFVEGAKSVGRDLRAMGEGVVEQVPNMVAPMGGMIAGGAAGSKGGAVVGGAIGSVVPGAGTAAGAAVGATVGGVGGAWLGASAGNTAVEGGATVMDALQKAGINQQDTAAVTAFLDQNGNQLLKQSAIKGGIIGAVDTATAGLAHGLLTAPAKAASERALVAMGIDLADDAAVKVASKSEQFGKLIAEDTVYQASQKGAGNVARNVTAAALEPIGEGAGEYLGEGIGKDNWDAKNAALEALSSVGQSGAMFAGQKAVQAFTAPRAGEADPVATPGEDATFENTPPAPGPTLALPAPVYEAGPDGVIRTTADANAETQAANQAEADRQSRIARGEVLDVTPVPKSEQLGLNPDAGPMSAAAALAVNSGATEQVSEQDRAQQAAENKPKPKGKPVESVNPETGEITKAAQVAPEQRAEQLQGQLEFIQNQAKVNGWDKRTVAARDQVQNELAALQPKQAAPEASANAAGAELSQRLRAAGGKTSQEDIMALPEPEAARLLDMLSRAEALHESTGTESSASALSFIENAVRSSVASQTLASTVEGMKQKAQAAPTSVKEGIEKVRAEKAQVGEINTVIAKQIPQMSDAELQQAATHYGPDHKRTDKLSKEMAKRGIQTTEQATESVNADAAQNPGQQVESPQSAQAAPQSDAVQATSAPAVEAPKNLKEGIAKVRAEKAAAKLKPTNSSQETASWVIRNKETGEVIAETYDRKKVDALNTEKYEAVPVQQHLGELNQKIKAGAQAPLPEYTAPTAGYNARREDRLKRITEATTPEQVDSVIADEHTDDERHMEGTGRVELAARAKKHEFDTAAREARNKAQYESGEWTAVAGVASGSQSDAENKARKLRESDPASEYRAEVSNDNWYIERRKKPAASTTPSIEGKDIGDGWAEFDKKSGTVGIPRAEMPQIKAEHRGAMVNFLNARGVQHQEETVPAADLKPTQAEFSRDKVAKAKDFEGGNRSILISQDGHVLDGHHQWMASRDKGEDVKVIRLDAPIRDLVNLAHEFPSSTTSEGGTEAKTGRRKQPGDEGYTLLDARNDLIEARTKADVQIADSRDVDRVRNMEKLVKEMESEAAKPAYGASNKLVTADRAEELRKRLKAKLGQLNSGIDPEILAMGAELAVFHIEAGTRKFADFAKAIAADLDMPVEKLRTFLRGWYNGARDMMEDGGVSIEGMDNPDQVRAELAKLNTTDRQAEETNEQPANGAQDQGRASEVRSGRSDPQQGTAPADSGDVAADKPADGGASEQAGAAERPGLRGARTDVAVSGSVSEGRDASDGRARAGGTRAPDARTGAERAAGAKDAGRSAKRDAAKPGPVESPAATAAQAQDLHIANPLDIVGGTPVQRFNRNRAALELLQNLEAEGRQANADEQKTLAGYIGWGSFGQELFQGSWEHPTYRDEGVWKERGQWLRDALGESAWKSAQRSITNAHYTDPPTVMAMWDMVRRMGFEGGKVLEPSMGTGNFFSMMPADSKARSQLTGIELDETTGAIAKQLFPRSNVRVMGYQDSKTPDGFYDLIIGNWPFENTPVADRRYNKLNPMLHDYFFLKTMDQVRPGGIVIGITSAGSMDKQNTLIRRELAKNAELVAAIRLPSGAFEEYAGTKVVTDIVILRKRPERLVAVPKDANWIETGMADTPSGTQVRVNQYYLDNPGNIIGTLDHGHGTTTFRAGMLVHRPDNMAERLQQAISLVPTDAYKQVSQVDHLTYYANETGERHGALSLVGDRLMVAMGDQLVVANDKAKYELKDPKKTADRESQLKAVVQIGKRHSALVDAERKGVDAEPARKALRESYQAFTKANGRLRDSFALSYLERIEDPFFAEIAALENDDGTPAAVMERSTTRGRRSIKSPSVREAYVLARNQSVNPTVEDVAALAGKDAEAVRAELLQSGAVFIAPSGDVVPSDIYLSGNVREKMREAQAGLAEGNAAMEANIKALQEVMPEDVPYFNIETKLGATWVDAKGYQSYIAHMLSAPSTDGIEVSFRSGRWKVKLETRLNHKPEATTNFGSAHISFSRLVQAAMSNQTLRMTSRDSDGNEVYDAAKTEEVSARIAKMREEFGTWLWSDAERRVDMEREYNEARNAWATPKYDGSFLTFEGMALSLGRGEFNLRQHQVNAIWRAIVNRRSLNAHEVGTGKTFTMGGIAVESRRYGIAKKPVILAHNANSAAVAAEIRMMYPSSRVLYVDNLDAKNRAVRLRQIANDDWDAIVIPHSLIDRLSLREETLMDMAADDIANLESEMRDAAAEDGINLDKLDLNDDEDIKKIRSVTAKELAKARKRIIESIKKQAQQASKEGAISFEELGIDMILVDEAHEFKKPPIVTRMQMKGLNTQVSGRSIALQFLTRYVRQMNNGGNVHTFTGTPITNTITEIYHQMRYVMESEMEKANVSDWDGWFGSFATEVQDVELSAAGDYEMVTRLAGFVNVPELRQMVGQYMDTVFADDMPEMQPRKTASGKQLSDASLSELERAELINGRTEGAMDRPYKKVVNASADMTAQQQSVFRELQQYAQDWRNATGKERREMMAEGDPRSPIITEGIATKASFDTRLLDQDLAGMEGQTNDDPNSKASRAVRNVLDIYNSHPQAGQVVFAEMGFGKSIRRTRKDQNGEKQAYTIKAFSTIHDIVERLVQGGIPREQIAIVDGSVSKEKRREIAEAMNESRIRVVIGSTDTLGVGVNMQRNLRAMHHLDAPYMPGELEQRNGRGQRQGNQWNTVLEFRYMTDRLDGRRWQILAVKQRFITAFMKADAKAARVIEGEAAADEQSDILESFSEAAGDPRILQRVKMQKKLESLKRKERMFTQGISDMRRQARNSQSRAEQLTGRLKKLKEARTEENINDLLDSQRENFQAEVDGNLYSSLGDATEALEAYVEAEMRVGDASRVIGTYGGQPLSIDWPGFHDAPRTTIKAFGESFEGKGIAGAVAKMRNYSKSVAGDAAERDAAVATAENMRKAMDQPFAQAADVERVSKQLDDLEKDLAINPVPPPAWLRQGAPIDSQVFKGGKPYIVSGHRYSKDGWFVIAEDSKGATLIPYMEATDNVGMPLYEEHDFVSPEVVSKDAAPAAATEAAATPDAAPKFSFAGRNAGGADLHRLATAQERIAMGENAEAVRKDTGWHRGADGKWRFEISDDQAAIKVKGDTAGAVLANAELEALLDDRKRVTAADVLDHPQLYAAYPKLATVSVEVMPEGVTAQARVLPRATGATVQVQPGMSRAKLSSALLHELQHVIQIAEGFAMGGSKKALFSNLDPTGADTYRRLSGEVEARNTQARQKMTPRLRREISPSESADVADDQVLVTFNGKKIEAAPANVGTSRNPLTEQSLVRAFKTQFPGLAPAVSKLLARGKAGQRGGVVLIDSADPLVIAGTFAKKTGAPISGAVELFSEGGTINGFYDAKSGLTFLVGPNLDVVTGPAVLLHEMTHGQQREKIDARSLNMLMGRDTVKNEALRGFLDRVAARMVDAGETANAQEATAYIVEQAVLEGRAQGFAEVDNRFLAWVDQNIGKRVGDLLRSFMTMARQWMLRNGVGLNSIGVDDLVQYAMAGVERAAQGDVVAGVDGPAFSRASMRELAGQARQELDKTFSAPGGLSAWHKTVGTMYNLAERNPLFKPVFEAAQGFIDDVSHYASDAAEKAPMLLPKLETWRDITKKPISAEDNNAIAKPIFEGTLMWTRDHEGKPVRVDTLVERAQNMVADDKAAELLAQGKLPESVLRLWKGQSAESYEKAVNSAYERSILKAGIVWSDAELISMFDLNPSQISMYREFRGATDRSMDTMARAQMLRLGGDDLKPMRDAVMDAADAQVAAALLRNYLAKMAAADPKRAGTLASTAKAISDDAESLLERQKEGYAPLSRFGKYTVYVQGASNESLYFGMFESKREANQMAENMRELYPNDTVTQGTQGEKIFSMFAGINPETAELFGKMMSFDTTGGDAKDQAFQEWLRMTKNNRSAMKRLIHRKGIAGYSEDVGRVLASFVYSNARNTSSGLNMGDLNEAVTAIPKEQGELQDVATELADYIKNPQEEGQAIRGLLFAQYLGGSIASAFVNMTQPVAVTFPWLSQFGGARSASAELAKAAKQMAQKGHQYEDDLQRALHDAEEDGTVSPQEVHQLMAQARGSGSLRAGDGTKAGNARAAAQNSLSRLSVAWGKLFGAAEQVNRRMTFIAAYRMAKQQNMANPAEFARRAVKETQFVYSKASKMKWGRGAVGGTLMTFKTYSIAYLELMGRLWSQGEEGSAERKQGRKAVLLMLGTMVLLSGAGGLPFSDDIEDVIDGIAQLAGYNLSTQKAKEQFLTDVFGKDIGSFIDKGITALPGMPLDVSGRLGMGNVIPGTGLLQKKTDHTRDVLEIAGPAGDMAARFATGTRKLLGGDIGGVMDFAPTAVRNAAKGLDMAGTGMYRDDKGYKVLDTNPLEAALKSIGFQPASVAQIQEANYLNQRAKAFYNYRAQEIRAQWAQGVFEKNPAKVQEARDAVADWNAKNPDQRITISVPDVMRRVREMSKSKDQRIADTAPKAMRSAMKADLASIRADMAD